MVFSMVCCIFHGMFSMVCCTMVFSMVFIHGIPGLYWGLVCPVHFLCWWPNFKLTLFVHSQITKQGLLHKHSLTDLILFNHQQHPVHISSLQIVKKEDEKEELEEKKDIIDKIRKKVEEVRESLSSSGTATAADNDACESFITKCKSNIILFSISWF